MVSNQHYSVSRLYIQTFKAQRKKTIGDIRNRYLAKIHIIKANAIKTKIEFINFRGSIFKKTNFSSAIFYGNDFWGASFNKCKFNNAIINDTVFVACKFKECSFNNTVFKNTIFVNTNLKECMGINISNGVIVLNQYPSVALSQELLNTINILQANKHLRKNKLLHLNKNRVNQLNIFLLLKRFPQKELNTLLLGMIDKSFKNITTYKKLEIELKKLKSNGML